ncbi:thioredoxin family protein [Pseudomonas sp. 210_17 TE3656]
MSNSPGATKMAVKILSHSDFADQVLKSSKPVVVEFYRYKADGSENASKRASVYVDEWAASEGRATFFRISLTEATQVAKTYDVQSAPTLVYFSGGEKKNELVGYYNDERPKSMLAKLL